MKNDETVKVAAAFIIGGAIGAAIALLYAPQSGAQTRKDIKRTARRIQSEAADLVEDTIEKVDDFVDETRSRVNEIVGRGVELSAAAKKEIVKALEQGHKSIEKQKEKLIGAIGL